MLDLISDYSTKAHGKLDKKETSLREKSEPDKLSFLEHNHFKAAWINSEGF